MPARRLSEHSNGDIPSSPAPTVTRAEWPSLPLAANLPEARTPTDRCARLILAGCDSAEDPKTIAKWASETAVGYSTLTDACRFIGVRPHDARDLVRFLRVMIRTHGCMGSPYTHFDVNDSRTLNRLMLRSGITHPDVPISLDDFVARQEFVTPTHPVVGAVRALIARASHR